jgi:hypothetical protein
MQAGSPLASAFASLGLPDDESAPADQQSEEVTQEAGQDPETAKIADLDNEKLDVARAAEDRLRRAVMEAEEEELREEAEEQAKMEAAEQAKKEAEEAKAKKAEEQATKEAEEQAKMEAAEQAKKEAEEAKAKKAEEQATKEAEEQAKMEAAEQAKKEAEQEQAKKEAEEEQAKKEAEEEQAKKQAEEEQTQKEAVEAQEEQAKKEAEEEEEAKKEAEEEQAKNEAEEEQAKAEAAEQTKKEATEAEAKKEAEEEQAKEAEEQATKEAEEQATKEAEEQATKEAEEQAKKEAEEQAKKEAEEEQAKEAEEAEVEKEAANREHEQKESAVLDLQKQLEEAERRLEEANVEAGEGVASQEPDEGSEAGASTDMTIELEAKAMAVVQASVAAVPPTQEEKQEEEAEEVGEEEEKEEEEGEEEEEAVPPTQGASVHYQGAEWVVQYINSKGLLDLKRADSEPVYGVAPTDLQTKKEFEKEQAEQEAAKKEAEEKAAEEAAKKLKPPASVGTADISKYQIGQQVQDLAGHEVGYVIELVPATDGETEGAGLVRVAATPPDGYDEYDAARSALAEKKYEEYEAVLSRKGEPLGMLMRISDSQHMVQRVYGQGAQAGITAGSILLQVNGLPVAMDDHAEMVQTLSSASWPKRLRLYRTVGGDANGNDAAETEIKFEKYEATFQISCRGDGEMDPLGLYIESIFADRAVTQASRIPALASVDIVESESEVPAADEDERLEHVVVTSSGQAAALGVTRGSLLLAIEGTSVLNLSHQEMKAVLAASQASAIQSQMQKDVVYDKEEEEYRAHQESLKPPPPPPPPVPAPVHPSDEDDGLPPMMQYSSGVASPTRSHEGYGLRGAAPVEKPTPLSVTAADLQTFFEEHAPEKVANVGKILETFANRGTKLLDMLQEKYGAVPGTSFSLEMPLPGTSFDMFDKALAPFRHEQRFAPGELSLQLETDFTGLHVSVVKLEPARVGVQKGDIIISAAGDSVNSSYNQMVQRMRQVKMEGGTIVFCRSTDFYRVRDQVAKEWQQQQKQQKRQAQAGAGGASPASAGAAGQNMLGQRGFLTLHFARADDGGISALPACFNVVFMKAEAPIGLKLEKTAKRGNMASYHRIVACDAACQKKGVSPGMMVVAVNGVMTARMSARAMRLQLGTKSRKWPKQLTVLDPSAGKSGAPKTAASSAAAVGPGANAGGAAAANVEGAVEAGGSRVSFGADEYEAIFTDEPLGVLLQFGGLGHMVVDATPQATAKGVSLGSILLSVNGESVAALDQQAMMAFVRQAAWPKAMHFWRASQQQYEVVFKEVDVEIAGQMGMVIAPDRYFHYVQHVLEDGLAQSKGVERDAVLLAVNGVSLSPMTQSELEATIHAAKYPKRMLFSKGHALLFLEQAKAKQSEASKGHAPQQQVGGEETRPKKKKGAISRLFKKKQRQPAV